MKVELGKKNRFISLLYIGIYTSKRERVNLKYGDNNFFLKTKETQKNNKSDIFES